MAKYNRRATIIEMIEFLMYPRPFTTPHKSMYMRTSPKKVLLARRRKVFRENNTMTPTLQRAQELLSEDPGCRFEKYRSSLRWVRLFWVESLNEPRIQVSRHEKCWLRELPAAMYSFSRPRSLVCPHNSQEEVFDQPLRPKLRILWEWSVSLKRDKPSWRRFTSRFWGHGWKL